MREKGRELKLHDCVSEERNSGGSSGFTILLKCIRLNNRTKPRTPCLKFTDRPSIYLLEFPPMPPHPLPGERRELSSLFFACVKLPYSLFPPPWMAGACIRVVHIRIVAFRGRIIVIVQWQSSSPVQGWILSSNNAKQQMRKNKGDDVSIHLLAVIPGAKCEEREREKMQECTYIRRLSFHPMDGDEDDDDDDDGEDEKKKKSHPSAGAFDCGWSVTRHGDVGDGVVGCRGCLMMVAVRWGGGC